MALKGVAQGFVFIRRKSLIHSLNPIVKLILSFIVLILSLLAFEIYEFVICFVFILIIAALAKVTKQIIKPAKFSSIFGLFIFVINLLIGISPLLSISYSLRFIAIIIASSVFFLTLSPDDIEYILRSIRFPKDLIFAFVAAVRFIPVLMLDMQQIMDAQKARGLELDKGSILKRIKNLIPILIPLVISAIMRSEEMAEAMEARAYGVSKNPTLYARYEFSKKDFIFLILSLSIFAFLAYLFV